jgi:hypothetical protein
MAYRTVPHRELRSRRRVHGVICLLPGRQMATRVAATVERGRQVIIVINVAGRAGHTGVPIGEWEPCYAVIEWRPCPAIHRVACAAIRDRKKRWIRLMRGIRRLLPGRQMAS